ncbi:MAG: DUF1573 domain-containing protein, partial [Calditrichia bacterium]|nr:DUF1573 domain-containing protein [Calditrichia bacterium]
MKKNSILILSFILFNIFFGRILYGNNLELLTPSRVKIENIKSGDTIYYEIEVKNVGQKQLEIYKVKSSCRCTILNFKPQIMQPDSIIKIQIAINTDGMRGRVTRSVSIFSN